MGNTRYSEELRANVVTVANAGTRVNSAIAKEFGIHDSTPNGVAGQSRPAPQVGKAELTGKSEQLQDLY